MIRCILLVAVLRAASRMQEPTTLVEHDDHVVRESCTIRIADKPIPDENGDGVIQIVADGVTVDFAGAQLSGAPADRPRDALTGIGVRISARNVTLRNAKLSGFRCALLARDCDGLTLERCDVSDNFAQRLRSTPAAEDGGDWLWPHKNDDDEWRRNYGAGICVKNASNITVRECRARRTQNGLILDRVRDSRVYDNDFSFLSGWGIAMWRCERTLISRNALDFCIRGYSHGVYNRGQDSAGILFFEQNIDNVIIENSATHGGDGLFGFAGREALGEDWLDAERERRKAQNAGASAAAASAPIIPPADAIERSRNRGNRGNLIARNDFSYAAAHGLELTFSFDTQIIGNRFAANALSGIWAGYSQRTLIADNELESNGTERGGVETGGVMIEHGRENRIIRNRFWQNQCGVHLWFDDDASLAETPWVRANGAASADNLIAWNRFGRDRLSIRLRGESDTRMHSNTISESARAMEIASPARVDQTAPVNGAAPASSLPASAPAALGNNRPIGARADLRGRDKIIITDWGPYDWVSPYLHPVVSTARASEYMLLGTAAATRAAAASVSGAVTLAESERDGARRFQIAPAVRGSIAPYTLSVACGAHTLERRGVIVDALWRVTFFAWTRDPREQPDAWRNEAQSGAKIELPALLLRFGNSGPSQLADADDALRGAALPRDRFGTLASTELHFPGGRWRIVTESDDGIRVWVDEKLVIDDWTWHAPRRATAEITVDEARRIPIRVEHFELDGFAVLTLTIEPIE